MKLIKEIAVHIFLVCLFLISGSLSNAQISSGGSPRGVSESLVKSTVKIPTFSTMLLDNERLLEEDLLSPIPARFSIFEDVSIDLREKSVEIDLPSAQGRLYLYQIESKDARSVQLFFRNFLLPDGGELFIYNQDQSIVRGAFTSFNNNEDAQLMIADFPSNAITIEYFEPYGSSFEALLELGSVGLSYKDLISEKAHTDELGYISVNATVGEEWQNEKHSVCKISYRKGNSGFICTGALLNNSLSDGTPYFLTANHCIDNEESAASLVAYFNLELAGGSYDQIDGQSLSGGADLLLTSQITDFCLLRLNETPPASYQPYYAPWDATEEQYSPSVGIHHPAGLPKRVSIDNSPPVSHDEQISWVGGSETMPNTHWKVNFDHGETAGGSSGSPLFSLDGRAVIGQLHGGSDDDFYGKLSRTIDIPPKSISNFLYSDDTEQDKLEAGYYPPENLPDPQFFPEFTNVCVGAPIQLTGMSAFEPLAWSWSFTPNTVTYTNGTGSTSKEPSVQFNKADLYSVTLTVTNAAGTASRMSSPFIQASNDLDLVIRPYLETDSCLVNFDSLVLEVDGAQDHLWSFLEFGEENFYIVNDTLNPVTIKMNKAPGASRDLSLKYIGSHGTCFAELSYDIALFQQSNDSVKDAIQLYDGQSGTFTNKCASVEENEPIPPITSCTGNSWCDEFGTGEDILGNSVWFYFIPLENGIYNVQSYGMDNQFAVYHAEDAEALLAGNYDLLGANDDYTDINANPSTKVSLLAGEKYLIQVDGSAGNVTGEFYFIIRWDSFLASVADDRVRSLKIYPQPVKDILTVECRDFTNSEMIVADIFDISGAQIQSLHFESSSSSKVDINTSLWNKGIYFIRFRVDNRIYTEKVLKF